MADATFEKKLLEALSEMQNPVKDTKAYNYKYATLEQVLGIVRPALQKHGLDMRQESIASYSEDGIASYNLTTWVIGASEGEMKQVDCRPLRFTGDAQKDGSWETYMRRYSLLTAFGLCGEDDDGAATTKKPATKKPAAKPAEYDLAKHRLVAACTAFAERHGSDKKKIMEGVKARPDYEDTAEFFNRASEELENE